MSITRMLGTLNRHFIGDNGLTMDEKRAVVCHEDGFQICGCASIVQWKNQMLVRNS